jgi:hypothetical protein
MKDFEVAKRKFYQKMKSTTQERFWDEMNRLHSDAFFKAVKIYNDAAGIVLPPRLQKQLHDKANSIRIGWEGLHDVTIDFSALTLDRILIEVQKEMARAAGLHGPTFADLDEAKEAIDEEWIEVLEAIRAGNKEHASIEIIQMIGVTVKLLRGLDQLVQEVASCSQSGVDM